MTSIKQLSDVFDDIICGNGVKRSLHDLSFNGQDYSTLFVERLVAQNFKPAVVKSINVDVGIRFPAFILLNGVALYGHLFWEVFTDKRKRKIWGSVIRNEKGDWKHVIPGNSTKEIYINLEQPQSVDINYLT
ncbi:MAG: hypothetical protein H6627_04440 [Calditrichae bacterium]|nr:hypothetical protein [Calditrichota bacterium]MCB9057790.1 hypothetical protein [Calditrichia bacterium]